MSIEYQHIEKIKKELREQISKEVETEIIISLENCACLGREAYGDYITKCKNSLLRTIRGE